MAVANFPKYAAGTQPFTVLIEGNIGSGKTTFLNHFKKFQNICLITEPVEKWRNLNGVNIFELMYKNPEQWAMPFQTYVTLTMLQSHTLLTNEKVKLMERSLFSARYCFVENMFRNKSIHPGMYYILQEWFAFITQSIHIQADLIVYLRTTPEIVFERIKKRARFEESNVPLDYLRDLHELHEDWLVRRKHGLNIPVLVLNANLDLDQIVSEYKRSEQNIVNAKFGKQLLDSPNKMKTLQEY